MEFNNLRNRLLITATFISTLIYLVWRIFFTIPFDEGTFSLVWAIILLTAEGFGVIESLIHFRNMSNIEYPERPRIKEEEYVDVDVFIATYNEPVDLLYKTVNGCLNMDYPDKNKVHIYICDDSNRPEMRELANNLGVNYVTRTEKKDAKAGNYNNALKHSASPLIVTFDADMIPLHDFLYACVPYFYIEEKVGFVQTPQSFYNPDLFQYNLFSEGRIPNEQDYFYRDIQVSKNKTNSVIYGGSNTIISRRALDEIGGFYTKVITEDFATGMLIQSKGYRCIAIDEIHAIGLSPSDLKSLIKQRDRWARGCIQSGRKLHILFRKGLNFRQKLSYISSISYWYGCIKRLIYILSPILFGTFNVVILKCTLPEILIFWLPMYILTNSSLKVLSHNIRTTKWTNIYETILFPSLLPSVIMESLGISQHNFSVTRKDGPEDDKSYRVKAAVPHAVLGLLSVIAIIKCILDIFETGSINAVISLFWLGLNLYTIIMSLMFMLGRKIYRQVERFSAKVKCEISFDNEKINCFTYDISERGVSIILDKPKYINYEKAVSIKLFTDRVSCEFKGDVVNVLGIDKGYKYAFAVNYISEENYRKLLNIVYDREPSLPKQVEENTSVFDDLSINIKMRNKHGTFFNRKLPRVKFNKEFNTDKLGIVNILNFNYEYVVMEIEKSSIDHADLCIHITDDITWELKFRKNLKEYKSNVDKLYNLYSVENYKDLINNGDMENLLVEWKKQYIDMKNEEKMREYKQRKEGAVDEFNENKYL